jgi:hypothetical protein
MILPESPKALALDGGLVAWGVWIVAHGAAAMVTILTIVILALRALIAWRDWKRG